MIAKRFAPALVTLLAVSILPVMTYAQGPGGPGGSEAGGPGSSPEKPVPKPRVRWQKPLKLPEQYRAKDKNNDGQIGLYEWDKKDYATFRKLDLNHDGFLTAEELTRGAASKTAKPSTTVATTEPVSKPVTPETSAASEAPAAAASTGEATSEKPASAAGDAAATPATGSTAGLSAAEKQWVLLDKDKDGKVSESEWGRSYLARPKFRDAGIAVTFPLGRDEFLQLYSQLPSAGQ